MMGILTSELAGHKYHLEKWHVWLVSLIIKIDQKILSQEREYTSETIENF